MVSRWIVALVLVVVAAIVMTQRLTGAPHVSRVQTLQTIRTSRSLAGVPF